MEARKVTLQLPRKLKFLLDCHPYKIAYGGRNSLKSHSMAGALLTLGIAQDLRILCAREVQKSLAQSVHQLLQDKIEKLGYHDLYDVTDDAIRCRVKDTLFRFTGLADHTAESIKSYEGFDIAFIEESQAVSKRSRQILFPTIFRTPGAEIWEAFNPGMDTDDCWERYVVNPPPGAMVIEMNYRDAMACGWWTDEQEQLRQYSLVYEKADYDNIWEGKPRSVVAGAIYTSEITDMVREQRARLMPYDPRLPVHRIWDLGWNDLMTVIMVQKPTPSSVVVVNYLEDARIKYSNMIEAMKELRYNWGEDWLPHDREQHHPTSGTNAKKALIGLGCRVKDIPKTKPESRIKAARMMFPRVYIDNTKRDTPPDRPDRKLGAGHLLDRLKRYKRHIPKNTGEEASPVHDVNSHAADAFGGLAEIVDRIRNDGDEMPALSTPGFSNVESSMGMLG
jgi:phage terminase large subunit